MKKFVLWLIKTFKLDIPTERVVEKIIERQVLPKKGIIEGDLYVNGSIIVIKGNIKVSGTIIQYADSTILVNTKED